MQGRDDVDEAQCGEGPALPADREHQPGHDDGGGTIRATPSDRHAGATPLRWDLATERRIKAGDTHRMWPQRGPITAMSPRTVPSSALNTR